MTRIIVMFVMLSEIISVKLSDAPGNIARTNPCTDAGHVFLVPGVLASGATNRACVSRFHTDGPASILLTLTTEDRQTVTASRELPPGDGGCIDISVPQLPNTKADLVVHVRYPESQCTWESGVRVLLGAGRVVAVYSERTRYRPGDTVRVAVTLLTPDLKPAHVQIEEVWLEGPRGAWEGTRVAEWKRVRTRLGIAQVQHNLDELAPVGKWTIRARLADGSQGAAAFWVGNYELPPFQLSVRHAPKVLRTSERLVWTVCVRYPWTEAVEGMLVIRIRGAGSDNSAGIRTAVRLRAPRACHRHAAAAKRVGLDGSNPPDVVVADFSFQEDGTRIWQNTTVVSQVVEKPVTLDFLTKHRPVLSPKLPYKLKVKATRWDDKPAANVRIQVCRSSAQLTVDDKDCNEAVTDDAGIARVLFTADDGATAVYKFEATLQNDTSISAAPLNLPVQRTGSVHAALGPLKADPQTARTFVPLYLNVKNVDHAITVHFVVISRGGIIYRWGATTQCPVASSADQVQTAGRDSICPRYDSNRFQSNKFGPNKLIGLKDRNDSDALLDRHLLRVMLPIKVTHQMCPDSHLVAYFYLNGELVSASKHFEMDECFANKVELTWASRQVAPGSTASLHISSPGPALCSLTALDTAAKWVQQGESIKDVILRGLRRLIEGHRNLTEYDAAGECFLTTDSPSLPTTSSELTVTWLAAAGVRVMGGNITKTKTCTASPMQLVAEEMTVPRSDFSEAWLWRLVAVSSNGSATVSARAPDSITRFEASAVCVARNGIGVSSSAVLQVFREFFIHADGPRRLRRGDSTIVRYRIFNYLYESLNVQIQILTDPHLEGPTDYQESACISARASVARRVELRARLAGNARVSIRAKSDGVGCGNATASRSGVSDEVIIQMTVDPEGLPVHEHKSKLLCGRGSPEARSSDVTWNWSPVSAVPGTDELTVWVASDITGPLLADADDLVLLPRGCGEQNMARMATNLLALKQLDPKSVAAVTAREHVARGFTRQLQYVHPSGGFSAFGSSDATPSTWLTAFAVRYLRKAHQTLTPGFPAPPALDKAEQWLLNQQMENGCFRNEGQVFHRELRGGLNEEGEIASVALTAYVITSLVESAILPARVLRNALSCLRALPPLKSKSLSKVYAHSLLAYTFMRLRRYENEVRRNNEAGLWKKRDKLEGLERDEEMKELVELLKMARRSGDLVWWETGSLSTSIEATGYALLALSGCPEELRGTSCAHDARAAIRWLSTHRNSAGGFIATQDTLVALEALTIWSSVHPATPTNLNVTIRGGNSLETVFLHEGNKVPSVVKLGTADQATAYVDGTGCAVVQATRSYNTYSSEYGANKPLSVEVSIHTDGPFNCDGNRTSCFCAAVVETCVIWTETFPEMALLEVSLPGGYGADASRLYSQLHHTDTLLRRIELTPSNSKATLYLGSRSGATIGRGHQCYQLHAIGPQANTKPAHARLHDYYRPALNDTQMYTIPEDCPPRIIHESNQYLASDNLFNKAKSLTNGGEIIITNEFTFEDIPEGIPLEDPLYDNLTQESGKSNGNKIREMTKSNPADVIGEHSVEIDIRVKDTADRLDNSKAKGWFESENKTQRKGKMHKITGKLADLGEDTAIHKTNAERTIDNENKNPETINTEFDNEIPKVEITSSQLELTKDLVEISSKLQELKVADIQESTTESKNVENPNLVDFHVIDSDMDLEVPGGIEGPVPAVVLPPLSFQPREYLAEMPYSGSSFTRTGSNPRSPQRRPPGMNPWLSEGPQLTLLRSNSRLPERPQFNPSELHIMLPKDLQLTPSPDVRSPVSQKLPLGTQLKPPGSILSPQLRPPGPRSSEDSQIKFPNSRSFETYHPAYHPLVQTYFYQPVMEDLYKNKFRYR